jgi:glycosyltransferase involved in cell wall biosynthesis
MVKIDPQLISIIMPVKNAGKFLHECLQSVKDQTEVNWELIAVNDNSTDYSKEILQHFAQNDARIKVLDNQGSGIISALHTGYQITRGNFIHRMDADDVMPIIKLKVLKQLLLENGKGNVITGESLLADIEKIVEEKIADRELSDEEKKEVNELVFVYLNRLSSLLYVLARLANDIYEANESAPEYNE